MSKRLWGRSPQRSAATSTSLRAAARFRLRGRYRSRDELVDALSDRLLSLREPGEIGLADGRVVVAVPVVVTADRPGPSRLVAVTADSVPRGDTVRSLVRGAEVIAGHQRGQRLSG